MSQALRVHGALLLVNIIYGANYNIAKAIMPVYMLPMGLVVLRVVGSTALFFLALSFFKLERIQWKDLPLFLLCSLTGVAINQLLFLKGLDMTTPINAALIMITVPILVMLVSSLMAGERITPLKTAGILMGAGGAGMIIAFGNTFSFGSDTIFGDLMIFINACSYGVFLVIVKPLMLKYSPLTVITWVFFFGIFMVFPFGYEELAHVDWRSFPVSIWLAVAYMVIATTFFAYLLNIFALSKVNPSLVGTYIYLQPVFATAIALYLGGDELTWMKAGAAALIFTGVYLVSRRVKPVM